MSLWDDATKALAFGETTSPGAPEKGPAASELSLLDYAGVVNEHYVPNWHHRVLAETLEKVASREIERLMVFMPPRHGKSELVSKIFPGWYLHQYPRRKIGTLSYAAELAHELSGDARDYYEESGGDLVRRARKAWTNSEGGGCISAGIDGSITGKGFSHGGIDDPYKGAVQAESETVKRVTLNFYKGTYRTRLEAGATQYLCQTRWTHDDLAAYLLDQKRVWHILCLEAIREDAFQFPDHHILIDRDPRKLGEPLWPSAGYDLDFYEEIRDDIGERQWAAQYQQTPSPPEGALWKAEWFLDNTFVTPPKDLRLLAIDWDTALTKKEENSASAWVLAGVDRRGHYYVLDCGWYWREFPELVRIMAAQEYALFIEDKANGHAAVQTLRAKGIPAALTKVAGSGDKVARTSLQAPKAEAGLVHLHESIVDRVLYDPKQGILKFPRGANDDLNDALVQALNRLSKKKAKLGAGQFAIIPH